MYYIKVFDILVEIVYWDVLPKLGGTDILFLHGQSFSSEDWENIKTLAIFSRVSTGRSGFTRR